jgi:hypothetical protein
VRSLARIITRPFYYITASVLFCIAFCVLSLPIKIEILIDVYYVLLSLRDGYSTFIYLIVLRILEGYRKGLVLVYSIYTIAKGRFCEVYGLFMAWV